MNGQPPISRLRLSMGVKRIAAVYLAGVSSISHRPQGAARIPVPMLSHVTWHLQVTYIESHSGLQRGHQPDWTQIVAEERTGRVATACSGMTSGARESQLCRRLGRRCSDCKTAKVYLPLQSAICPASAAFPKLLVSNTDGHCCDIIWYDGFGSVSASINSTTCPRKSTGYRSSQSAFNGWSSTRHCFCACSSFNLCKDGLNPS